MAEARASGGMDVNQAPAPLFPSRVHSFRQASGILAVLVGLAVLLGWRFEIQALKSVFPGLASMKPNTALAFVLCGFAVWALQVQGKEKAYLRRPLAVAAALTVTCIGLFTLLEYLFQIKLGIDDVLCHDTTIGEPFPGRMSPLSALCFVLTGIAVLLLQIDTHETRRLSRLTSLCSAVIALGALFGYAYSIAVLYRLSSYTGMAVHTAAVFALLSAGIQCARPDEGLVAILLKRSSGGTVMRRAVPISLAAAFVLGWLRLEGLRLGLFGTEMGVAVAVTSVCAVFVLSAAWAARTVDEQQKVLETFVKYAPASIAMFDRNMRYVTASRRWLQECGIEGQDILGKSHYGVIPTLPEHWKKEHQRGLAGEILKAEDDWVALDGKKHTIRWEIHPWGDAGASTGGIIIFMEDITERKRSAEQFRLALEAAPTGMIMVDEWGKIVLVNAQVEKLFDYARAELLGQPIEMLVPERFRDHHPGFRADFFANPGIRPMGVGRDLSGLRKDHTEMPIEIGLTPLETSDGRFVISSVADITERKRAAAGQFRMAIEASPTGMIMVDPRGKIVMVNAQVEKIFGYDRAELMGQTMEILMPERYRRHHTELRAGFASHPSARPVDSGLELWGLRKDGKEVPLEIGLNPLETQEGKFVLSSVVDITERKRAEQEREGLLERLQISNTELGNTLKEREVLLQEIHHRVKNNLQVISSLINLQLRRIKDPATREVLQEGQARVSAISLIHEMLYQSNDFANVPFSEYARTLAAGVFNMVGVVPGCVSLELAIDDIPLAVDKAIPCGLILNELITNALKHGFPGGRHGTVRVELVKESSGKLRLSVEDDGLGLPAGFDIHQTRSLGLHLVGTLAEQLGAEFKILRDRGTCFQITFDPGAGNETSKALPHAVSLADRTHVLK
jgi:PAS domain S-box-containing protein